MYLLETKATNTNDSVIWEQSGKRTKNAKQQVKQAGHSVPSTK